MHANDATFRPVFHKLGRGIHRIAWFGDVTYVSRTGGASPMAQLVLSRWKDNEHAARIHRDQFTTIAIPIAYLRLFRIGDLWNGEERIGTDEDFVQETFENLVINDTTVEVAPVGLPLNQGGTSLYPLPFSALEAHRDHTGAFCVRVPVANNVTLVVPCMELIRFYFGASGGLLKRLFSGALASRQLYTSARINPATGIAHLDLFPGLPGVAASTVGRIAFDPQARKAMRWLINSGVSAAANKERHYPRTTFPFLGETTLTAQGRWIEQGRHRVFLAERLARCTHPFPFQKLFYTSQVNLNAMSNASRQKSERMARHDEDSRPKVYLADGMVARDLQAVAVPSPEEIDCSFPDLMTKYVRRVKPVQPVGAHHHAAPDVTLATGDPLSSSNNREAEVTTETAEQAIIETYPEGAAFLHQVIEDVRFEGNDSIEMVPIRDEAAGQETPFTRADYLVPTTDSRLETIWATRLSISAPGIEPSLLLLVKEMTPWANEGSDDQGILLPYHPVDDPQGQVLEKLLIDFAGMDRGPEPNEGSVKNLGQIGLPYDVNALLPFLMRVWGIENKHYEEQKRQRALSVPLQESRVV